MAKLRGTARREYLLEENWNGEVGSGALFRRRDRIAHPRLTANRHAIDEAGHALRDLVVVEIFEDFCAVREQSREIGDSGARLRRPAVPFEFSSFGLPHGRAEVDIHEFVKAEVGVDYHQRCFSSSSPIRSAAASAFI